MSLLNLADGDFLSFVYNYSEAPRLLKVESWYNDKNMKMLNFSKGRAWNIYLHQVPISFINFVENIVEVSDEGDCGFECIALALDNGSDSQAVRTGLIGEVQADPESYSACLGHSFEELKDQLQNYWLDSSFCLIVATLYERPVIVLSLHLSELFVTQKHKPPTVANEFNPIVLAHVNGNHFVEVKLRGNYPIPPIAREKFQKSFNDSWKSYYSKFFAGRYQNQNLVEVVAVHEGIGLRDAGDDQNLENIDEHAEDQDHIDQNVNNESFERAVENQIDQGTGPMVLGDGPNLENRNEHSEDQDQSPQNVNTTLLENGDSMVAGKQRSRAPPKKKQKNKMIHLGGTSPRRSTRVKEMRFKDYCKLDSRVKRGGKHTKKNTTQKMKNVAEIQFDIDDSPPEEDEPSYNNYRADLNINGDFDTQFDTQFENSDNEFSKEELDEAIKELCRIFKIRDEITDSCEATSLTTSEAIKEGAPKRRRAKKAIRILKNLSR